MTGLVVSTATSGVFPSSLMYFTGAVTSATTATSFITTDWVTGSQPHVLILSADDRYLSSSTSTANNTFFITTDSTSIVTTINSSGVTYYYTTASGGYCAPLISEDEKRRRARERERKETQRVMGARAAIKRALKLMDNVGFGKEVSVFLGGDTVEVSHPESMFKFLLKKRAGTLIQRTHSPGHSTPYELELYTKTDVHVANLCVYMQDTPMLDQVLALAMFIRSGDEEYILEKANWSCVVSDPVLRDAIRINSPSLARKIPERLEQRWRH